MRVGAGGLPQVPGVLLHPKAVRNSAIKTVGTGDALAVVWLGNGRRLHPSFLDSSDYYYHNTMNEETMWRVANKMQAAADRASAAADRIEESARRIAGLLEDGYGGNGLRLIELLENAKTEKP